MIHNEYIRAEPIATPFPNQRYKNQFIGQPYDENNKTLITLQGNMNKDTITEYFELDQDR